MKNKRIEKNIKDDIMVIMNFGKGPVTISSIKHRTRKYSWRNIKMCMDELYREGKVSLIDINKRVKVYVLVKKARRSKR